LLKRPGRRRRRLRAPRRRARSTGTHDAPSARHAGCCVCDRVLVVRKGGLLVGRPRSRGGSRSRASRDKMDGAREDGPRSLLQLAGRCDRRIQTTGHRLGLIGVSRFPSRAPAPFPRRRLRPPFNAYPAATAVDRHDGRPEPSLPTPTLPLAQPKQPRMSSPEDKNAEKIERLMQVRRYDPVELPGRSAAAPGWPPAAPPTDFGRRMLPCSRG
jgi:hypothetical protein